MYVQFEQHYYESTYKSAHYLYFDKKEANKRETIVGEEFARFVEQDFDREELEDQDEYSKGKYIELGE